MSNYGLIIRNPRTQKAFDEGYVALNFVGAGITARGHGLVCYLDIQCPTQPVLFYRSAEANRLSLPHYVWHRGGNSYRVYTIGEAEVFVFSTHITESNDAYGLRIYARNNRLVYQSSTETLLPVARVVIPHGNSWHSGTGRKLAYTLHGIARQMDRDLGTQRTVFHNTVIQSLPGGFAAWLFKSYDDVMTPEQFRRAFHGHQFLGFTDLHPDSPISMLVVDVHDLDYQGRQARTFY